MMEQPFKFGIEKASGKCWWTIMGQHFCNFSWSTGDALCDAIRRVCGGDGHGSERVGPLELHRSGGDVVLSVGQRSCQLGVDALRQIGAHTRGVCRQLEEEDPKTAERMAFDGAILLRAGFPVGISDNHKINDMVIGEATTNRTVRRAIPGMRDTVLRGAISLRKVNRTPLERLESCQNRLNSARSKLLH